MYIITRYFACLLASLISNPLIAKINVSSTTTVTLPAESIKAEPLPPTDPTPITIITANAAADTPPPPKKDPIPATDVDALDPDQDDSVPPAGETADMVVADGTKPEEKSVSLLANASTDNAAGLDIVDHNNAIVAATPLIVPAPDTSTALITPEASAAAIVAAKKNKATIIASEEKKEADKTTSVSKANDLFAYNLTGMKEAGVDISKNGFGMTARFDLGWGAYMRATFAVNTDGLLLQAYIKEINLANILKVTGTGPDGKYGTPDDGVLVEIRLDKKIQRVALSGLIDLFGAMSETEIIIASDKIKFMAYTNLFGMFSTTLLAQFTFSDFDFFMEGAVETRLIAEIEKSAKEAITKVGDAVVAVSKKAAQSVQKARKKLEYLKKVMNTATAKLHKAQATYFSKLNAPQKDINEAVKAVEAADREVGNQVGKILEARRKMLAGRKAIAGAITKVNSLNGQVSRAIKKLKSIARGMKWYEFWKVAELAYWSAAVAALETARGIAIGALEIAKASITPLAGLLTATYAVSYVASKAALEIAYLNLEAALIAANPLTMKELGEVLAASLEISGACMAYYAAQGILITTWATFKGIEEVTKGITIAMREVISAAFEIFRIDGAAFKASVKNVIQGSLDLYLLVYIFTVKKNLKLTLDMSNPDKTFSSIGNMIADIFNPLSHGSSDDIFAKVQQDRKNFMAGITAAGPSLQERIQQNRASFANDLASLDGKSKAAAIEQEKVKKQQEAREAALKKIQDDNAQRLATMRQKYPFTETDIKNMGSLDFLSSTESATIVDEKNPVSCSTARMQGLFRWLEAWKLSAPNSGCVLFDVSGDRDIYIGFHHEIDEKKQKRNKDFDIVLGAKENTVNIIRDAESSIILSCGDPDSLIITNKEGGFQRYWISFDNGYLAIGRGGNPGQQLLFDWQVSNLSDPIKYFSLSSGNNELSFVNIHTAPAFKRAFGSQYSTFGAYNQFNWPLKLSAENNSTITFKAKAAQNIALGLCDNPTVKFSRYLAVFGAEGNTTTTMATGAADGKTYNYLAITEDASALLPTDNQTTYYPYWATFNNGHFVIGSGSTPSQNIISEININPATLSASAIVPLTAPPVHVETPAPATTPAIPTSPTTPQTPIVSTTKPPEPTSSPSSSTTSSPASAPATATGGSGSGMKYFSFSSWDDSVEIRDIVVQPAVPCPIGTLYSAVNRKFACTWNDAWKFKTPGKGIITWEGKGSCDMSLALHTNGTSTDNSYTYLCTIGAQNNTHTTLSDSTKKALADNTDIDSTIAAKDSYTPYWFSYDEDGYCMLGTGKTPGQNVILETSTSKQPITHFCFTNGTDHVEFNKIATQDITAPLRRGTQYTAAPQTPLNWNGAWKIANAETSLILLAAKAQSGLSIGLKDDKGNVYTVTIDGTTSSITDAKNTPLSTTTAEKSYINDAYNFYAYWVLYSRATGTLSYGCGEVTPKNSIAKVLLSEKPTFTSFGIGNPTKDPAYCKKIASLEQDDPSVKSNYGSILLNESYAATNTQKTPAYLWQDAWKLAATEAGAVTCRARTAGTIAFGLGNSKDGALYDIYINGKEVSIRKGKTIVARSIDKKIVLPDANNFYGYWISYYNGHIRIGSGTDPRENTMIEWVDSTPAANITHFSPSSIDGFVSYKTITSLPAAATPMYQVYSACQEKSAFNWYAPWELTKPEQGLITFELKTDSEAVIGLTGTKSDPTYTIRLGKNCIVTKGGATLATSAQKTPVVTGNTFQPFWILFDKNYLAIGTGLTQNNESLIIDYQDVPTVDIIQRFSLSSNSGQATYRKISSQRVTNNALKRNTNFTANACKGSYTFSGKWSLVDTNTGTIMFDARGTGPYRIAFDNRIETVTKPLFEIIFGSKGNTCTELYKDGMLVQSISDARGMITTPEHANPYWVIFNQGHITVGSGYKPGVKTFLDWKDSTTANVSYFSFSSDAGKVLYSAIQSLPPTKQEKVNEYVIPANRGKYKFDPTWCIPSPDFGGVMIKARGANDICIGLHTGTTGTPRYEVVIGAEKNTCTLIKSNGTVVASIDSDSARIRNANIIDAYWVLCDHGTICVGRGEKPGTNILLYWTDPTITSNQGITYYGLAGNDQMITVEQISPSTGIHWPANTLYNCFKKQGAPNWNPAWKIRDGQTLTFDVTAPNGEIYVGFNDIPSMLPQYTVIMGGWQNTVSAVLQNTEIAGKYNLTTKPITKSMWITYTKTQISVGTGDPHSKELFSWKNPKPATHDTIAYFSLSSGNTSVLYENIAVITAAPIAKPKTGPTVPGIQISGVPKPAQKPDDEDDEPVTNPTDPRYLAPAVAALMTPTKDEVSVGNEDATADTDGGQTPVTTVTKTPAQSTPAAPPAVASAVTALAITALPSAATPAKSVTIVTKKDVIGNSTATPASVSDFLSSINPTEITAVSASSIASNNTLDTIMKEVQASTPKTGEAIAQPTAQIPGPTPPAPQLVAAAAA